MLPPLRLHQKSRPISPTLASVACFRSQLHDQRYLTCKSQHAPCVQPAVEHTDLVNPNFLNIFELDTADAQATSSTAMCRRSRSSGAWPPCTASPPSPSQWAPRTSSAWPRAIRRCWLLRTRLPSLLLSWRPPRWNQVCKRPAPLDLPTSTSAPSTGACPRALFSHGHSADYTT